MPFFGKTLHAVGRKEYIRHRAIPFSSYSTKGHWPFSQYVVCLEFFCILYFSHPFPSSRSRICLNISYSCLNKGTSLQHIPHRRHLNNFDMLLLVLEEGFEPSNPKVLDPKSSAFSSFATPALLLE